MGLITRYYPFLNMKVHNMGFCVLYSFCVQFQYKMNNKQPLFFFTYTWIQPCLLLCNHHMYSNIIMCTHDIPDNFFTSYQEALFRDLHSTSLLTLSCGYEFEVTIEPIYHHTWRHSSETSIQHYGWPQVVGMSFFFALSTTKVILWLYKYIEVKELCPSKAVYT